MEIERKFLVRSVPKYMYRSSESKLIEQYYLNTSPEIRIRSINGDEFRFTYKSDTDNPVARHEHEFAISKDDFSKLRNLVMRNPFSYNETKVKKRRYQLNVISTSSDVVLDEFLLNDDKDVLKVVEVEFATIEDASGFVVPQWFVEEVTSNPDYRSINLAKRF